jgi:hypothetical protein
MVRRYIVAMAARPAALDDCLLAVDVQKDAVAAGRLAMK